MATVRCDCSICEAFFAHRAELRKERHNKAARIYQENLRLDPIHREKAKLYKQARYRLTKALAEIGRQTTEGRNLLLEDAHG